MDGENHGTPIFNGWLGGVPLFLETPIYIYIHDCILYVCIFMYDSISISGPKERQQLHELDTWKKKADAKLQNASLLEV